MAGFMDISKNNLSNITHRAVTLLRSLLQITTMKYLTFAAVFLVLFKLNAQETQLEYVDVTVSQEEIKEQKDCGKGQILHSYL